MSESSIPPALTPAEWETVRSLETDCASLDAITFLEIVLGPNPSPHSAAAALLYDRPFGFTAEMADALRALLDWAERRAEGGAPDEEVRRSLGPAREAVARLGALVSGLDAPP